jgi:phosphate transporter
MASNVGGMASPISSPQNIVALGNMTPAVSWLQWFMITLPCCIIIDLMIFALLLFVFEPAKGNRPHPPELFSSTERWESNPNQRFVMIVCFVTILLWCFESKLENLVGDMGVIAILPMVLFFGTGILTKDDFNNFLWTVIMLAMGGISLGKAVQSSGLLNTITEMTMPLLNGLSSYSCLLIVCAIVLIATTFISHTVGALILLPVIADIGQHLPDPQPRTLVMAAGKKE